MLFCRVASVSMWTLINRKLDQAIEPLLDANQD